MELSRATHDRPGAATTVATVVLSIGALLVLVLSLPDRAEPPGAAEGAEAGVTLPTPTVDPAAPFTVWERNDDGTAVRWDPCEPIEVVLSTEGAPPAAQADLTRAVALIAEASGLSMRYAGTSVERPVASRLPFQPERYGDRWAPVLVAWDEPSRTGVPLRDVDRGVAVPVAVGPPGDRTYVSGQVILNRDRQDLVAGFGDRSDAWGATLVHELVHVLGLGHVEDPAQLMYRAPGAGPVAFGPGDLAGLAAVGPDLGCRPAPTPGPVRVSPPPSHGGHGVP